MNTYRHTQRGTLIIVAMLVMSLAFIAIGVTVSRPVLVAVPILVLCGWLFHSLTIEVNEGELRWRFGPGLICKRVTLSEISAATPVRTNVIEGWGIHLSRFGWLYNVSGFDAVAITLKNGKRFALGTDEPQALASRLAPRDDRESGFLVQLRLRWPGAGRAAMQTIYFDYNATTPLDPAVREVMLPFLGEVFGNPSSVHHVGRRARALLDDARDRVARIWRCRPSEVVFTSGGTESNNLAILGTARLLGERGRHIITTSIEHHAVLHPCDYLRKREGFDTTYLPVDGEGRVNPDDVKRALRADTVLVSVMAANNEIGTLQPVAEIGALCRERGVLFHTDAVQWFGKEPFASIEQFNADLVSSCAHKFHGPKGAGALYIRSPLHPDPVLFGGGHENERRAGTESLATIIGFTEALERFVPKPVFPKEPLTGLTNRLLRLVDTLHALGVESRGSRSVRLANTIAFTVTGVDSITLLAALDLEGVCASSGSACSAGSLEPSHVMLALGVSNDEANCLIRFSLGRETTEAEVAIVEQMLPSVITQARC